jgi:hypothetical protein
MTPAEKLAEARDKCRRDRERLDLELRHMQEESEALRARVRRQIMPKLRPARASEYSSWLQGWVEQGGRISHVYDDPTPKGLYMLLDNIEELPPGLCGAFSLRIIVPRGLTLKYDDLGHCSIYFMDGYRFDGTSVPAYSDTVLD